MGFNIKPNSLVHEIRKGRTVNRVSISTSHAGVPEASALSNNSISGDPVETRLRGHAYRLQLDSGGPEKGDRFLFSIPRARDETQRPVLSRSGHEKENTARAVSPSRAVLRCCFCVFLSPARLPHDREVQRLLGSAFLPREMSDRTDHFGKSSRPPKKRNTTNSCLSLRVLSQTKIDPANLHEIGGAHSWQGSVCSFVQSAGYLIGLQHLGRIGDTVAARDLVPSLYDLKPHVMSADQTNSPPQWGGGVCLC